MRPILVLLLLLPLAYTAVNFIDDHNAGFYENTESNPDNDNEDVVTPTTSNEQPTETTTTTTTTEQPTQTTPADTTTTPQDQTTGTPATTKTTTTTTTPATDEPKEEGPTDEEQADEEPKEEVPAPEEPAEEPKEEVSPVPTTTTTTTTTEEPNEEVAPVSDEPKEETPAGEEPAVEEPKEEVPAAEEPKEETPAAEEPASEEPKEETETATAEPIEITTPTPDSHHETAPETTETTTTSTEEPKEETPAAEEPTTEEPKEETAPTEEPKEETPATEEPKEETPASEEPAAEETQEAQVEEAQVTPADEEKPKQTTTPISDEVEPSEHPKEIPIVTPKMKTPVENLPPLYGGLILPQVRANSTFNAPSDDICGGTIRDKVHFITTQNIDTEFKWYIETPFANSYCLFRISENIDQNNETAYVNLRPVGRTDVKPDGFFPCGKTAGAEAAFFDIPDEIDCDACVLEWIWAGPNFQVRQCADITVIGGDDIGCLGQCQNGGICQRGECVCPEGYTGSNCEYVPGAVAQTAKKILAIIFFVLLGIILILLLIMCLYWCAKKRIDTGEKTQIYHTNRKYNEFDDEQVGVEMRNRGEPAGHIKAESQTSY